MQIWGSFLVQLYPLLRICRHRLRILRWACIQISSHFSYISHDTFSVSGCIDFDRFLLSNDVFMSLRSKPYLVSIVAYWSHTFIYHSPEKTVNHSVIYLLKLRHFRHENSTFFLKKLFPEEINLVEVLIPQN